MSDRFESGFPFTGNDALSGRAWALVLLSLVVGYCVLVAPVPFFLTSYGQFVPTCVFATLPLVALALVAGERWKSLFRSLRFADIGTMFGLALLYIVTAGSLAIALKPFIEVTANPAGNLLLEASRFGRALFFLRMVPQILGEELITVLPFLALFSLFRDRLRKGGRVAIGLAWFLSSLWFGFLHLPTYGFNVVQSLVIIASARIALTLAYLRTKNVLVATGAHLTGDWLLLGGFLLLGEVP